MEVYADYKPKDCLTPRKDIAWLAAITLIVVEILRAKRLNDGWDFSKFRKYVGNNMFTIIIWCKLFHLLTK